jgi:ABC-2 type transport system ATP-binding protein
MSTVVDAARDLRGEGGAAPDMAISLRAVSKRFVERRSLLQTVRRPFDRRYHQALREVTCDIPAGEFFGLLGPNGAGKTTLFKIVSNFVTPDGGSVLVHGVDARVDPGQVRSLVTPAVADERSLRWRLTAKENLRLFATLYGVPAAELDGRVAELLEAVGLHETGTKMVGQFSTGMKQRLLIARALIPRPRVLILDEPTRGLDPLLARSFRTFLKEEVGRRHGCTVLVATHNAEEAFELCDRVGVLDRGRLLVVGEASRLREQFGHPLYRVWTSTPQHRAFEEIERRGLARLAADERVREDGWTLVDIELSGDIETAAAVIQLLVSLGAVVGRFERVGTSLADLIERVVMSAGGPNA